MKNLKEFILESVSTGKRRSQNYFPDLLGIKAEQARDTIIQFLENQGFSWFPGPFRSCEEFAAQFGRTNYYYLGACEYDEPNSWWICFGNEKRVYFCRLRNQHRDDAFRVYHTKHWMDFKSFDDLKKSASIFFGFKRVNECLTEAVSKGGHKNAPKYVPKFPKDQLEDQQKIIDWLEACGYVKIPSPKVDPNYQLKQHYNTYHEKCYVLGLFEKTSKGTHWIMFYDGDRTFFLRLDWSVANMQSLRGNAILEPGNRNPKQVTLDELIKELEK